MYIEFKLPSGAGGMAAYHASHHIRKRVKAWADTHNVTITSVHSGYRMTFMFGRESDYTLFALSWNCTRGWDDYKLITDPSITSSTTT